MSKPISLSAIEVRRHDWDRLSVRCLHRRLAERIFSQLLAFLELARTRERVTDAHRRDAAAMVA